MSVKLCELLIYVCDEACEGSMPLDNAEERSFWHRSLPKLPLLMGQEKNNEYSDQIKNCAIRLHKSICPIITNVGAVCATVLVCYQNCADPIGERKTACIFHNLLSFPINMGNCRVNYFFRLRHFSVCCFLATIHKT